MKQQIRWCNRSLDTDIIKNHRLTIVIDPQPLAFLRVIRYPKDGFKLSHELSVNSSLYTDTTNSCFIEQTRFNYAEVVVLAFTKRIMTAKTVKQLSKYLTEHTEVKHLVIVQKKLCSHKDLLSQSILKQSVLNVIPELV